MPNFIDVLLLAIVLLSMIWGWRSGLLRQLVAVTATMVAFMVAAELYLPLGGAFNDAALSGAASFFQGGVVYPHSAHLPVHAAGL